MLARTEGWIASWSLSSGAHSRDPVARNDGRDFWLSAAKGRCRIALRGRPAQGFSEGVVSEHVAA